MLSILDTLYNRARYPLPDAALVVAINEVVADLETECSFSRAQSLDTITQALGAADLFWPFYTALQLCHH